MAFGHARSQHGRTAGQWRDVVKRVPLLEWFLRDGTQNRMKQFPVGLYHRHQVVAQVSVIVPTENLSVEFRPIGEPFRRSILTE